MLKAIIAFLLFIATQVVASLGAMLWLNWDNIIADKPMDEALLLIHPEVSGVALFFGSLILIGLLIVTKVARKTAIASLWKPTNQHFGRAFIAFLLFAIGESFLLAPLELNDFGTTEMFEMMKDNVWCILLMCFIGPLSEEFVFREGIVRNLAYKRLQPVIAVIVSALLFALVHGNPAQAIPAAIMGFILGIFYIRTGNIQLCAWAHICNNSMAVALFFFPQINETLEGLPVSSSLVIGTVFSAVGLSILWQWWKVSGPSLIERENA